MALSIKFTLNKEELGSSIKILYFLNKTLLMTNNGPLNDINFQLN